MHRKEVARIRTESRREARNGWRELCGCFYTDKNCNLFVKILPNHSKNAGEFKLFRSDIVNYRNRGPVWGLFHSHPISDSQPKNRDLTTKSWGNGALIYDVIGDQLDLWLLIDTRIERLKIVFI